MFALSAASYRPTIACSTILVAADMVMTNSHCAYIGVSDLNKTCDSLYFAFSNASGRVEAARCSKILWRDKRLQGSDRYRRGDNDFALIKLDHPLSITPLKFSSQPIQRGDTVYPMVVDQVSGVQARIVKLECSVKKIDVRTGVATLSNCPIIAGNSGSAILNEEKNIVGIIFASSNLGIRGANEDLSTRSSGTSNGFAYTTEHLRKILGSLLDLSSGEYPL